VIEKKALQKRGFLVFTLFFFASLSFDFSVSNLLFRFFLHTIDIEDQKIF